MLKRFLQFIEANKLFSPHDKILAGISGGIDSVVMLDLLTRSGFAVGIAHCNFGLRAGESDADEFFVEKLGLRYGAPFFRTSFNTSDYADERGISVEMAARELRYRWFEDIRLTFGYDRICVAHHRDDQLETFFLNLVRGTGLMGLTGIRSVNGKIVRPLLFASRKEIEKYCHEHSLVFSEDGSNSNLDIQRNKIRHKILPLIEELNPSFREGLTKTINNLRDASIIYSQEIENAWNKVATNEGNDLLISIEELKMLHPVRTYLFQFLRPFNFKTDVVNDIVNSFESSPGKQFLSNTHRLVRDREYLIIRSLNQQESKIHYIDETCCEMSQPVKMRLSIVEKKYRYQIPESPRIGCIDLDKIQFPLSVRQWKKGDYFRPLGMEGFKKLSDFFVDLKLNLPEKENTWILFNGDEIVWIIGKRLDDRYKITSKTKNILKMELIG